jgi:hypothetical protein
MTGDAAVHVGDEIVTEPVVVVAERFWSDREPWEVAGLDVEVPKLLLDLQRRDRAETLETLLEQWNDHPQCWLAIQPFLTEIQVWGATLPESCVREVKTQVSKEGLRLVDSIGHPITSDLAPLSVRATGGRFQPREQTDGARREALRDAFAVGAHYVELRDEKGHLRAIATDRLVDLKSELVGPMSAVPSHFSRHDVAGRCPMCQGRRVVTAVADSLVIASRQECLDADAFLTPQANAVMKGVRQNELRPFLRRMAKENLWDATRPFGRLDAEGKDQILYGFWSRPGQGSFLKRGEDPAKVSSWLRWDGMYRHVLEQAPRSHDKDWAKRLSASAKPVSCPRCGGSGLQTFAALLEVNGVPFTKWTLLPQQGMYDALNDVKAISARQQKAKKRLLYCLASLSKGQASSAAIVKRVVETFTTMPSAEPNPES